MNKALSIIGTDRAAARLSNVIGAGGVAPMSGSSMSSFLSELRATAPTDVKDGIGTLAGGVAGALYFKKHRVLGGIAGASLGRNLPALLKPAERNAALCNLGATGTGLLGARFFPKHPVIGFIAGLVAGETVIHFGGWRR